jgi:prepilin-type N-terminal cleavage/methylation domain-containing protein
VLHLYNPHKPLLHKKAFTLIELIFVVIIIGIIMSIIVSNPKDTKLREAAIQLISHIRYTQHLAMIDDKFNINDALIFEKAKWYKARWQIIFTNGVPTANSAGLPGYTIFSDFMGKRTGHPDREEIALDPLSQQIITSGVTKSVRLDSKNVYQKANLGKTYGITDIKLHGGCYWMRISFDHLGRPSIGSLSSYDSSYNKKRNLISSPCNITLTDSNAQRVTIVIEEETGYIHFK